MRQAAAKVHSLGYRTGQADRRPLRGGAGAQQLGLLEPRGAKEGGDGRESRAQAEGGRVALQGGGGPPGCV
mgnify:CR=1 FL=1